MTDPVIPATDDELLRLEYVPLDLAMLWDDNKKIHDTGQLIASIERYGFKDPPKYEPHLNDGRGGIVEGNGRFEALAQMRRDGFPAPRGVAVIDSQWLVPVLFGVDAASEAAATAYGIDHNNLTLAGSLFGAVQIAALWNDGYVEQLQRLAGDNLLPVSVAQDDLALLGTLASGVPFPEPADEEDDADDPAPGYDTIRVKVYRFAQIKDMVAAIRELISEHGWEADVEVPAT